MAGHRRPEEAHRGPLNGPVRFAALDFETADYTPSSACAVGVVIPLRHHDALSDAEAAARIVLRAFEGRV